MGCRHWKPGGDPFSCQATFAPPLSTLPVSGKALGPRSPAKGVRDYAGIFIMFVLHYRMISQNSKTRKRGRYGYLPYELLRQAPLPRRNSPHSPTNPASAGCVRNWGQNRPSDGRGAAGTALNRRFPELKSIAMRQFPNGLLRPYPPADSKHPANWGLRSALCGACQLRPTRLEHPTFPWYNRGDLSCPVAVSSSPDSQLKPNRHRRLLWHTNPRHIT